MDVSAAQFDALLLAGRPLLDVRAPVEFERGAIPGATNLPLLDDEERHRVGIRYKESGQDAAIALGHELVGGTTRAERTARWCEWLDAHPDGVLYCFRGGLRSRTVRDWVEATGRELPLVDGGYKALRAHLLARLDALAARLPPIVVGGRTGVGKTRLLHRVDRPVDLEGLAHHRGSAFGPRARPQPTPVDFENHLALRLMTLAEASPDAPIVLEDESRNVGRLSVPPALLDAMAEAPLVMLEEPLATRVSLTLQEYVVDGLEDHRAEHGEAAFESLSEHLLGALGRVRKRLGGKRHDEIEALLRDALEAQRRTGDVDAHRGWIERMLTEYYDPMYDHQIAKKEARIVFRGDADAVRDWIASTSAEGLPHPGGRVAGAR